METKLELPLWTGTAMSPAMGGYDGKLTMNEMWWVGAILRIGRTIRDLHERVIDRDNEDFACALQGRVVDESGHVGAGARRACRSCQPLAY